MTEDVDIMTETGAITIMKKRKGAVIPGEEVVVEAEVVIVIMIVARGLVGVSYVFFQSGFLQL